MQNTTSEKGDFNLLGAMAGPNVRYGKNRYQNNFGQYKNYNTFRNVRGRQTNFQFGENNFQRNHFAPRGRNFRNYRYTGYRIGNNTQNYAPYRSQYDNSNYGSYGSRNHNSYPNQVNKSTQNYKVNSNNAGYINPRISSNSFRGGMDHRRPYQSGANKFSGRGRPYKNNFGVMQNSGEF